MYLIIYVHVYVYICVCVFTCSLFTVQFIHTCMLSLTYMYVCVCVCVCDCVVHTYVVIEPCTCMWCYLYMYTCIHSLIVEVHVVPNCVLLYNGSTSYIYITSVHIISDQGEESRTLKKSKLILSLNPLILKTFTIERCLCGFSHLITILIIIFYCYRLIHLLYLMCKMKLM